MASRESVEEKLRQLIGRLNRSDDGGPLGASLPEARLLALHLTDLGADYWAELTGGRMGALHEGRPEDGADITIRVGSDELIGLIDGERSMLSSYLGGQIRIEASVADLLRLRGLLS